MARTVNTSSWNGKVSTHWVDCRFCGDGQPAMMSSGRNASTIDGGPAFDIKTRRQISVYSCATCGTFGRGRDIRIMTPWLRRDERTKCSGVCLNGKHSCDCRCNGRCHGAGECKCGETDVVAKKRPASIKQERA